ncbi:hypothetical protein L1987_47218 [Smallanthus sonchifolius]|uniref:Uncharacterized protein n=1 Tax=Smallanthus sonchifolius TaxID=185202 RepID=A0ACB9G2K7_9ASTR|nr:hypothetical protein L1987_47218 [Smallanthus sonchifolius]
MGKTIKLQIDLGCHQAYYQRQEGCMKADRIDKLPGQPEVGFDHYAGYVTVDAEAGRALFDYFAESPYNRSSKPLVLWLKCSMEGPDARPWDMEPWKNLDRFGSTCKNMDSLSAC